MSDVMPPGDYERLFQLRCRSKRGEYISPDDFAFLEMCWKKWPAQYSEMRDRVFEETKPFGSKP